LKKYSNAVVIDIGAVSASVGKLPQSSRDHYGTALSNLAVATAKSNVLKQTLLMA